MKKAIVIILAILLAIFIGIILPILINNNAIGSTETEDSKGEGDIIDLGVSDNVQDDVQDDVQDGIIDDTLKNKPKNTSESTKLGNNVPKGTPASKSEDDSTPATTPIHDSEQDNGTYPEGDKDSNGESKVLSESWVEEMIAEYGHHISDDDMADLRRLYSQVDIVYVQGIVEDGYTDEDIEEVKIYLQKTLGSDYPRGKDLFYKYSYLMMEVEI